MPSPDTSAQDAPVASQEAEAREAVVRAGWSFGGPNRGPGGRASLTAINKALDAYAAVIRAAEREKYAALVEAATAYYKAHIAAIGLTAPPWTTKEEMYASMAKWRSDILPLTKEEISRLNELRDTIRDTIRALAALEEAESA